MAGPTGGFEKSISRTQDDQRPGCLIAFFSIFLLTGLGMSALFVWPLVRIVDAHTSWQEVPCTVVEARVDANHDSDGSTYSVEAEYTYSFAGRDYTGDRYDFFPGASSGYAAKARVAEALPPGTVTTCRVDPENPAEAVLSTRLTGEYWLALFPIPFLLVGAGGIVFTFTAEHRRRRRAAEGIPDWLPETEPEEGSGDRGRPAAGLGAASTGAPLGMPAATGGSEPLVLDAQLSPLGKLVGVTLIAAFWNGITGVFVWQAWKSWAAGTPDGCLTIFIIPFVLIGLLLLIGIPYQLLALFNPRPRLEIAPGRLVLGGTHQLRWSFTGRPARIRRLTVSLVGVEEADYRQGTTTRTDTETFATIELLNETQSLLIRNGSTSVTLPADTMHSFEAPDNRIEWKLSLQGEIRYWPDVIEELPLTVHPLPIAEGETEP